MAHNPSPPWRRPRLVVAVAVGLLVVALAASTKVVDAGEAAAAGGRQLFDAEEYASEKYDTEVVPAIEENAVPLTELLAGIAADPQAAGERYGHRDGPNARWAFATSVTGVAGTVAGSLLPLSVEGLPAEVTVTVQVGPAVNGTALRDATGLITFDQFLNQLEYADASSELNNQVKATVLADLDVAALAGKRLSVVGAFSQGGNLDLVRITPVRLDVVP